LLLARLPNLAAVDVNGKTSFCFALRSCHNDDGRCALMLLEAGASLELANRSALCWFAATSTAAIQALIDRGVVVRELRVSGDCTLLHMAAWRCRDADVFEMLVNVCSIDLEARTCERETCLHFAARGGNVFSLRWLLNAGADLDSVTADGSTPLYYANSHNDAVILLAAGADVCARDKRGRTALHRWTARGLLNELPSLFPLIAAGADLDAVDDGGNTCRQLLARRQLTIDPEKVEAARRDIAKARIDFVRYRALEVCIGLQSLRLDALQVCEILQFACGPSAPLIPFHIWWTIATTVKHFFKMK
jgi:ankyrin repeat protein